MQSPFPMVLIPGKSFPLAKEIGFEKLLAMDFLFDEDNEG